MTFTVDATSLSDIISQSRRIAKQWNPNEESQSIWYRGIPNTSYDLLPGLYRKCNSDFGDENLFLNFQSYATPYLRNPITDDWEWYFLMQHYGMPTRLLDWTESLLAAVFFSMQKLWDRSYTDTFAPAVWLMDAGTLNNHCDDYDGIITPGGPKTEHWLPGQVTRNTESFFLHEGNSLTNKYPIAILPKRTNSRIAAQQGMFTVHGSECVDIADLFAQAPGDKQHIACIRLSTDDTCLQSIWDELVICGINKLALFPELQSVADHVKAMY